MPEPVAAPLHDDGLCTCVVCAGKRAVDMPEQLVTAFLDGDLVIFAGAGVSTETRQVFPYTLYEDIAGRLGVDRAGLTPFPELMSAYEAKYGRMSLLDVIKRRLDYVKSFPAIDGTASLFHRELATAFTVTDIVTTNWDDYFERCCGATPFLTPADWAFWKASDRKVFKLHGSISSPGSVVVTADDYARCQEDLDQGLLGAQLKTILATKTVVFIGYSFRDSDFNAIYDVFKRRMEGLVPRAYLVTLDEREPPDVAKHLHVLRTDARYFIEQLKALYPEEEFIADERFAGVPMMCHIVRAVHLEMLDHGEMREDAALFFAANYHDGLLDAFDHQMANMGAGQYSHRCHTEGVLRAYEDIRAEKLEAKRFDDVAYVEGYMNGLMFLLADDETRAQLPLYFVFGYDGEMRTYDQFREVADRAEELDPEAFAVGSKQAATLAPGVVFQHTPFLL